MFYILGSSNEDESKWVYMVLHIEHFIHLK